MDQIKSCDCNKIKANNVTGMYFTETKNLKLLDNILVYESGENAPADLYDEHEVRYQCSVCGSIWKVLVEGNTPYNVRSRTIISID